MLTKKLNLLFLVSLLIKLLFSSTQSKTERVESTFDLFQSIIGNDNSLLNLKGILSKN